MRWNDGCALFLTANAASFVLFTKRCPRMKNDKQEQPRLSTWQVIKSVMSAAIGVQNNKNREQDFQAKNSIYIYIGAGIIFTVLFVLTVALVVRFVLVSQ